jgi:hypothetical protein
MKILNKIMEINTNIIISSGIGSSSNFAHSLANLENSAISGNEKNRKLYKERKITNEAVV